MPKEAKNLRILVVDDQKSMRLLIRSTGQVKGTVRYGELEIERGGRLSGTISMLEAGES